MASDSVITLTTDYATVPLKWRLPPDICEASWSWAWEPIQHYGPGGYIGGVSQGERFLTCRVAFNDTLEAAPRLLVEAEHASGSQTATATMYMSLAQRQAMLQCGDVAVPTSLGNLTMRPMSWTSAGIVTAWLQPHSVVAFVEALDDYVTKWRRGDYVEF